MRKVRPGIEASDPPATTASVSFTIAQKLNVDVPITEQVHAVLHEGRHLFDAIKQLLTRARKDELWGFAAR